MASKQAISLRENRALFKEGKRRCKDCRKALALKHFYNQVRHGLILPGPQGYQHVCKKCMAKRSIAWIAENKERHAKYEKASRERKKQRKEAEEGA
jgi:hypothetical protein